MAGTSTSRLARSSLAEGCGTRSRAKLNAFRRLVDADPGRVHAVIDDPAFTATFGHVSGETLTRVPQGYRADHPDAELLKLKGVVFMRQLSDADAASPDLPGQLADTLAAGRSAPAPPGLAAGLTRRRAPSVE